MADKPSFLNALRDPRFREDVGRGLTNALNRGMVAGTIGGPVDLAALAMRPLGYNVEQPVGGSEWIGEKLRQMGYVTDERNPVAEGLANALAPAAIAGAGKVGAGVENALSAGARNLASPSSMAMQSQRGAVTVGLSKNELLNKLRQHVADVEKLAEQHGTVYVRWSPTSKRDLLPGATSRDFVSGSRHGGLSAVPITGEMHPVDIAKSIAEYGFLRMQDPKSVPRIYAAERIGTDSDGYASIANLRLLRDHDPEIVRAIDAGSDKAMDLLDDIEKYKSRIERGASTWKVELASHMEKLKKLGFTSE